MKEIHTTFCRFCHAFCGIKVTVENGRAVKVIGDIENPLYHGYSCIKGRSLPEQHYHPDRLLHSKKRVSAGSYESISAAQAMDQIADRLQFLIGQHGPRSIALYSGTYTFMYPAGSALATAFMEAIGSPMHFTSGTIDQPGKPIATALHGRWNAGAQPFADADVCMLIGTNPLLSMYSGGALPATNPAKHLHDAKKRGLKLIVIDPRLTETAKKADIFLQPRPGEDPTILAGIIRVILEQKVFDQEFVAEEVEGPDALAAAVAPFTPDYVERRADVPADQLIAAALMFATASKGNASTGTGPGMAPPARERHGPANCRHSACSTTIPKAAIRMRSITSLVRCRRDSFALEACRIAGIAVSLVTGDLRIRANQSR
jgi:anaerobic selenocysteine-containing dehydrogenase